MGHSKKEQWQKDLSKALESFTDEWLEEAKSQKVTIRNRSNIRGYNNSSKGKKHRERVAPKGGNARAKTGGIEQIKSVQSFENSSKGGKVQGPRNVESGHWKKVQEAALEVVTQEVKCPHCSEVGNLNIMNRWHFDKCKWQGFDFSLVHKMSNNGMSQKQIARELGITRDNVRDILSGKKHN